MAEGMIGIDDTPGHGRRARPMLVDEFHAEGFGFGIEDVVNVALTIDGDGLGLVLGYRCKAEFAEKLGELLRLRMGELDEFETIGAGRIVLADLGRGGVMRIR